MAIDDGSTAPCSTSTETARLRENLDQLRKESRPVKWQRRFEKVATSLEEVLASYEAGIEGRRALHQRLKRQTLMLQLLDLDLRWHLQRTASPTGPAPFLPSPTGPLGFRDLPMPDSWSRTWEHRVLLLTSSDLAWLHCDWLQCSALLMYKAELYGPSSFEHQQLRDYADRYAAFNQHLIRLIPLEWRRRSLYNLNTMAPIAQPPEPAWLDQFLTTRCKAKPYLLQAFHKYHKQAAALQEQYTVLVGQYSYLAAARASGQDLVVLLQAMQGAARDRAAAAAATAAGPDAVMHEASQVGSGARGEAATAASTAAATAAAGHSRGKAATAAAQFPTLPVLTPAHTSSLQPPDAAPCAAFSQPPCLQTAFALAQGHAMAPGPAAMLQLIHPAYQDQASGAATSTASGLSWPEDAVSTLDQLLCSIQGNLVQQRQALRQCVFATRFSDDIVDNIRVYLLLYPLAIDTVDFLEAAAGSAAPSAADLNHPQ